MKNKNSKVIVLIQSRLSSNRLPGKALLSINGLPIIILCAKRAANTGKKVKVVTSDESTDDEICKVLEIYKIPYFRGSLENVLKRFNDALSDMNDNDLVFRLTADNVLPDGEFLDEMESDFKKSNVDIIGCDSTKSNLPYGISAELTKVKYIRESYKLTNNPYDLEHVTPYLYRNKKSKIFVSNKISYNKNLRVTIDTFDDYISVASLFHGIANPTRIPIKKILNNIKFMKYRPLYKESKKPLTLGGVQFGMKYGITNINGMTKPTESIKIIRHAISEGIEYIDTAASYGESEKIIGKALTGGWSSRIKIITKLLPFNGFKNKNQIPWSLHVRNSVLNSCINLKTNFINTLMLHRAEHLHNKKIIAELLVLKDQGIIGNIGFSVQNPKELEYTLCNKDVSIIQMPFNILDYRWNSVINDIKNEKNKRKIIIHARSPLLQGLLISNDEKKWKLAGVSNNKEVINWLKNTYKFYEKKSIADLCISFVNSQDWIDSVVVGIDTLQKLFLNLESISMPLINKNYLDEIINSRPKINEKSLDPSKWKIFTT